MKNDVKPCYLLLTYAKFTAESWDAIAKVVQANEQPTELVRSSYVHVDGTRLIQFTASERLEALAVDVVSERSRKFDALIDPHLQVERRRQFLERRLTIRATELLPTAQSLALIRTELPMSARDEYESWSRDVLYPALALQGDLAVQEFRGLVSTEPGMFHLLEAAGGPAHLRQSLESEAVAAALGELSCRGIAASAVSNWRRFL